MYKNACLLFNSTQGTPHAAHRSLQPGGSGLLSVTVFAVALTAFILNTMTPDADKILKKMTNVNQSKTQFKHICMNYTLYIILSTFYAIQTNRLYESCVVSGE